MMLAVLFEAIRAVGSRPQWSGARFAPQLSLVETVDRRVHELPFVGQERREDIETVQVARAANG